MNKIIEVSDCGDLFITVEKVIQCLDAGVVLTLDPEFDLVTRPPGLHWVL